MPEPPGQNPPCRFLTTAVGAYPKPDYVRLPDWFSHPEGTDSSHPTGEWADAMAALGADAEAGA